MKVEEPHIEVETWGHCCCDDASGFLIEKSKIPTIDAFIAAIKNQEHIEIKREDVFTAYFVKFGKYRMRRVPNKTLKSIEYWMTEAVLY